MLLIWEIFNENYQPLVINCEVTTKPSGWDSNWDYSIKGGITVNWNVIK